MKIYPPETFYPVPYGNWQAYFNDEDANKIENVTKNSYTIHVWNKLSASYSITGNSKSAYAVFAEKYCPKVFRECDMYF